MKNKHLLIIIALFVILLLSLSLSLKVGAINLSLSEIVRNLLSQDLNTESAILLKIRLPRILLAIFVGAGLAACGAVFQGMLRNPLAEPFTLGTSGGAALGVALGIMLNAQGIALSVFALAGALFSTCIVYLLAWRQRFSVSALILSGVVLSFFFSSCVSLIIAMVDRAKMHSTILWLMGDLSMADIVYVKIVAAVVILGVIILQFFGRDLDILSLGEEKALHLGIAAENLKKILFFICSVIVASCVASSGIIGFVGLIIPHMVRFLGGPNHKYVIIASGIYGAIFLLLSDTIARIIIQPMEFPVGVITGFVGGLFFLVYFLKSSAKR